MRMMSFARAWAAYQQALKDMREAYGDKFIPFTFKEFLHDFGIAIYAEVESSLSKVIDPSRCA